MPLAVQAVGELDGQRLQVECGYAPFIHHVPGAHACAARCAVDGEKVQLGLGTVAQGHGQLHHGVGSGLEGDALESQASEPVDLGHEAFVGDEAQTGVALELLDGASP